MNIKRLIKDEYNPAFDYELIEYLANSVGYYLFNHGGSFNEAMEAIGQAGRYNEQALASISARANELIDAGVFGEEVLEVQGVEGINTRQEAYSWLNSQIDEYGGTRYFPADVTSTLNALIEKFGNTYFWSK